MAGIRTISADGETMWCSRCQAWLPRESFRPDKHMNVLALAAAMPAISDYTETME